MSFCRTHKTQQISWISINMFIPRPKAKLSEGQRLAMTVLWLVVQVKQERMIKETKNGGTSRKKLTRWYILIQPCL